MAEFAAIADATQRATSYSQEDRQSLINAVISALAAPEPQTLVSKCYSNDRKMATEVQAYAKLAGRDWTYYVKDLELSIGRNTDPELQFSHTTMLDTAAQEQERKILRSKGAVDIDLGPAKVVSRKHAVIAFNLQQGGWELHVLGRNGAKVNFERTATAPQATPIPLSSGTILDIGGTQMTFILPDQEPVIAPLCFEYLAPTLVSLYGVEGNNNALLSNILRNTNYYKEYTQQQQQQQQKLHQQHDQQPQQSQIKAFKMYGGIPAGSSYGYENSNGYDGVSGNDQSSAQDGRRIRGTGIIDGFPQSLDFGTDLSREENKNVKPPHSYATMITQAILSTDEGVISLADIYKYISNNYAYYRFAKSGWQNSIRHNLSLNKAFEKVPRKPNEPGKGMKWRISKNYQSDFLNKWRSGKIGKIRRGSSVSRQLQLHMSKFNSLPVSDYSPSKIDENGSGVKEKDANGNEGTIGTAGKVSDQNISQNKTDMLHQSNMNSAGSATSGSTFTMMPQTANTSIPPMSANGDYPTFQAPSKNEVSTLRAQSPQGMDLIAAAASQLPQESTGSPKSNPPQPNIPFTHSASSLQNAPSLPMPVNKNPTNNALVSFTNAAGGAKSHVDERHRAGLTSLSTTNPSSYLSPTYDSLLRSPTRAFHVTAMEAYTPERGSGPVHRSPAHSKNPSLSSILGGNGIAGALDDSKRLAIPPLQPTRQTPMAQKSQNIVSSPGFWNLLQFSSVNNTPAFHKTQGSEKEEHMDSSPLKRDSTAPQTTEHKNKSLNSNDNPNAAGKELMLDTEGAKLTVVDQH